MKAVIVEVKGRFAAVLSDDGCIEKVKNNKYAIGQVIEMKERSSIKISRLKIWTAAAAAFVVLFGGTSAYACSIPYSYVSVDVNPSIELTLNIFDRVLSVSAVNEDGAEVLSQIDLNHVNNQNINDAIAMIVDEISNEGYFSQGDGGIIIATASKNPDKADVLAEELDETVNGVLGGDAGTDPEGTTASPDPNVTPDPNAPVPTIDPNDPDASPVPSSSPQEGTNGDGIEIIVISVGYERVQEARELGVTPGKLNLVQKLQASTTDEGDYATEEWIGKSVQQIQAEIKANRKDAEEALPGETPVPEAEEGTTENEPEETGAAPAETDKEKGKGNGNNNGSDNGSGNGNAKGKSGGKSNGNPKGGKTGN